MVSSVEAVEEAAGQADPQPADPATAVLLRPGLRPGQDALPHDGHVRLGEAARRHRLDRPLLLPPRPARPA